MDYVTTLVGRQVSYRETLKSGHRDCTGRIVGARPDGQQTIITVEWLTPAEKAGTAQDILLHAHGLKLLPEGT